MSYILSALRKAENDRRIGEVPDLLVNDAAAEEETSPRSTATSVKIIIGLAVLLVVNGALFVLMKSNEPVGADATVAPQSAPEVVPQEVRKAQSPISPNSVPLERTVAPPAFGVAPRAPDTPQVPREIIETPPSPPIIPAETNAELVDYIDLPAATRERLPEMNISGHVFVPGKPRSSRVIINGRLLRAGQIVEGDLRIEEILAREIIFELNGGRFRMQTSNLF